MTLESPGFSRGEYVNCTCCGHHDDADHNASVVLKMCATDEEFLLLCEKEKYHHKALQAGIRAIGTERNKKWQEQHPATEKH